MYPQSLIFCSNIILFIDYIIAEPTNWTPKPGPALLRKTRPGHTLKTSIPKFSCLSQTDLLWWNEFLQVLEESVLEQPDPVQWPFTDLKQLAQSFVPENEQPQLPQELIARHSKATKSIPKVIY